MAKSSSSGATGGSSSDVFGTYLGEIQGRTAIEQIVRRVREQPCTVGQLARELSFTPEEIASAVGNAVKLGLLRLEAQGDETLVKASGAAA